MPHPGHRLDLQLVPTGPDARRRVRAAFHALCRDGFIGPDGFATERSSTLIPGGFVRARVDLPDAPRLWANQQGGFRATCPGCGRSVVGPVVRAARSGGAAEVRCDGCGWSGHVGAVRFHPPAAWGEAALVLADVGHVEPSPAGRDWLARALGSHARIGRRP